MDDFTKQAKDRFEELSKKEEILKQQISVVKAEKHDLRALLITKGVIEKKARKKKPPSSS